MASGPFVFDGEYGQREEYHEQARSRRNQEYHADSEDHGADDSDGDPAEQWDQVLHMIQHARASRRAVPIVSSPPLVVTAGPTEGAGPPLLAAPGPFVPATR